MEKEVELFDKDLDNLIQSLLVEDGKNSLLDDQDTAVHSDGSLDSFLEEITNIIEDVKGSKSSKLTTETKDMKICDPDGKSILAEDGKNSLLDDQDTAVHSDGSLDSFLEEITNMVEDVKGSKSSKVTTETKDMKICDPDGKLQHYYNVMSEKVSKEVAQIVVWEGAVKNRKIKAGLSDLVDEDCELDEDEAGYIAKLFSSHINTEQKRMQIFLPALKAIATCEWEEFRSVSIYMLTMLLHKLPKSGISLAIATLPKKDYYRVYGEAVTKDCEILNWPKFMVRMPKPNKILSLDQFCELLSQDMEDLGYDGKISWILLLGYSPESTDSKIGSIFAKISWSELIHELSSLIESKGYYDQDVINSAGIRLVRAWGEATTLGGRVADVKKIKKKLDHKEFERIMDQVMSSATYPLDNFKGSDKEPCVLVMSPNPQFAVKLFEHTMRTSKRSDVEKIVMSFTRQKIKDQTLAAVFREMARIKLMDEELADDLLYSCSSESLLYSCVELLRIAPNPHTHPFMEIMEECDERTCFRALELLSPDLYAPNCSPDYTNALHLAASFGSTSVVKEILARGFHRLLDKPGRSPIYIDDNRDELRPAALAVQATHFATAKELFQAMESEGSKMLCTVTSDIQKPEINLHNLMDEVNKERGARWDNNARNEGEWKTVPVRLEKNEVQERVEFIQTALDATVKGRHVDLTLMIQDQHGIIPDQFSSGPKQTEIDPENGKKKDGKTLYRKIARSQCEDLISHECFATLTNIIWIDYGIVKGMLFSLYLLFMLFLTTSLVLAARSSDPSQYNNPVDRFRLFCEIITLIWVLVDLVLEIYEVGRVIYKSIKQHTQYFHSPYTNDNESGGKNNGDRINSEDGESGDNVDDEDEESDDDDDDVQGAQETHEDGPNGSLGIIKDVFSEYFFDWQNVLDDSAILCVLLIIPFRIVDSDNQWVFAALAFMFHGLRIFKYAIMFKAVGEYVAILVLLIKRDVPQFMTVFLVIIFSLGGALYLSLIGHYNENNVDTENNNETSEVYLLWWTGVRILAEGSALTYYGRGGFNWLGVLIYWLFLFIVVVVLLNILIAQFSKSYEEETERAQINVILTRTQIIVKMEQSALTRRCIRLVRRIRVMLSRNPINYNGVERQNFAGEREEDKVATSEQIEELHSQTTNLGLQLRKQLQDNTGKNTAKVEEMKSEFVKETREALKTIKEDMDGKLIGLERVVIDTRRYVDEIKELLLSMKRKEL